MSLGWRSGTEYSRINRDGRLEFDPEKAGPQIRPEGPGSRQRLKKHAPDISDWKASAEDGNGVRPTAATGRFSIGERDEIERSFCWNESGQNGSWNVKSSRNRRRGNDNILKSALRQSRQSSARHSRVPKPASYDSEGNTAGEATDSNVPVHEFS